MYLAMFDLSGIQNFIFQTNRLKEIAGGSYLVSKALFGNVPELAKDLGSKDWKKFSKDDLIAFFLANTSREQKEPQDKSQGRAQVIYVGGGNALVLFNCEGTAKDFAAKLKCKVFEDTGGALRICWGGAEVGSKKHLNDVMKEVYAALDENKASAPQALPARGFSINALDNETFEPVLYFEDAVDGAHIMPRGRHLKLRDYEKYKTAQNKSFASPLEEVAQVPKGGTLVFEDELGKFFTVKDRKRFLAFVHIDGNTMGQRIRKRMETKDDEGLPAELAGMRDLSKLIGICYKNALRDMIIAIYGKVAKGKKSEPLPFRPVVADGDDITFICRSEDAFRCVSTFVDKLHHPTKEEDGEENGSCLPQPSEGEGRKENDIGLPQPSELSVGCGIAFARDGYPFSTAYDIAEQLCKNAKASAIKRRCEGSICYGHEWDDSKGQPPISSVDFRVCQGELTTNVKDFRGRNHEPQADDGKKACLCKRPYQLDIQKPDEGADYRADYRFESFLELLGEFQERSERKKPRPARSKLKGLRDAYGEGAAKAYGEMLISRDSAVYGKDSEHERIEDLFKNLFEPDRPGKPDGGKAGDEHATLFDVLDVMDLCRGTSLSQAPEGQSEQCETVEGGEE